MEVLKDLFKYLKFRFKVVNRWFVNMNFGTLYGAGIETVEGDFSGVEKHLAQKLITDRSF